MSGKESVRQAGGRRFSLADLVVAFALAILPAMASAVVCTNVTTETGIDTDQDGFSDFQECTFIDTLGTPSRRFHSCQTAGSDPQACLDPNVKDVFVIVAPAANSLLPGGAAFNAFAAQTFYNINFNGLSALGLRVHQLRPEEAHVDRFVTAAVANFPSLPQMKAVKMTESLNVSGSILGYCQYGTPLGLDGCVVYTQRTRDFIASSCGLANGNTIWTSGTTSAPSTQSTLDQVLNAYTTYLILHETGHSLGGLTAEYNSRFGGYHYKPGAGMVMEQAVTYSLSRAGKCIFYISPAWNQTLDPPAVKLK